MSTLEWTRLTPRWEEALVGNWRLWVQEGAENPVVTLVVKCNGTRFEAGCFRRIDRAKDAAQLLVDEGTLDAIEKVTERLNELRGSAT